MGNAPPEQIAAAANAQTSWDPSVKALTAFPQVLAWLAQNLQWTTGLGNAYYNQPQDVLQTVQVMRQRAEQAGNLQSTPQEEVTQDQGAIDIEPTNPQVVYVPTYNPWAVYGAPVAPYPGFSFLGAIGSFFGASPVQFGLNFAMDAFLHTPWGFLGWGLDWLAHTVLFNHSGYYTHSASVRDWGFPHAERPARPLSAESRFPAAATVAERKAPAGDTAATPPDTTRPETTPPDTTALPSSSIAAIVSTGLKRDTAMRVPPRASIAASHRAPSPPVPRPRRRWRITIATRNRWRALRNSLAASRHMMRGSTPTRIIPAQVSATNTVRPRTAIAATPAAPTRIAAMNSLPRSAASLIHSAAAARKASAAKPPNTTTAAGGHFKLGRWRRMESPQRGPLERRSLRRWAFERLAIPVTTATSICIWRIEKIEKSFCNRQGLSSANGHGAPSLRSKGGITTYRVSVRASVCLLI